MASVSVGCKLPNGLKISHQGVSVKLAGANASRLINGFGITVVDKALFDAWMAEHKAYPPVAKGMIFAVESERQAEGASKERAKVKTGLEGLNPDKPAPGMKKAAAEE